VSRGDFLCSFAEDGIGIAIQTWRPKAMVPLADLPSHWDHTGCGTIAAGQI
jgi:hypothetical protein